MVCAPAVHGSCSKIIYVEPGEGHIRCHEGKSRCTIDVAMRRPRHPGHASRFRCRPSHGDMHADVFKVVAYREILENCRDYV